MDALILGLYAFCVWLIFFKFKWLPWNTTSMVIVITIPVVALTLMILLLNVFAPSSADVRVIKPVVNVVPQVGGRVLEVPVEPNRLVKKGEVLFRIDPTRTSWRSRAWKRSSPTPRPAGASSTSSSAAPAAASPRRAARCSRPKPGCARSRPSSTSRSSGSRTTASWCAAAPAIGSRSRPPRPMPRRSTAQLETARGVLAQSRGNEVQAAASERQVRQRIGGKVGNVYAPVAQVRAQLDNARWQLSQTTVVAPSDGYAINVQLRTGSFTAAFPITPAMTFVENTYQVVAFYQPERAAPDRPGQRGRVHPPGDPRPRVQGQGRLDHLGPGPGPVRQQHAAADDRLRADRSRAASRSS